jgi:ubiquitin carboxyl-terminal hydrolase L3
MLFSTLYVMAMEGSLSVRCISRASQS